MNSYKRSGNRWTVNELISLQREYELLEWTVGQIAEKHQRSVEAILFRLESEGFISSWNDARGFNTEKYQSNISENVEFSLEEHDVDDDEDTVLDEVCDSEDSEYFDEGVDEEDDDMSIDDDESDVNKLTERVWKLETSVTEINSMMKQMFDSWVSDKSKNRSSPRNSSPIDSVPLQGPSRVERFGEYRQAFVDVGFSLPNPVEHVIIQQLLAVTRY